MKIYRLFYACFVALDRMTPIRMRAIDATIAVLLYFASLTVATVAAPLDPNAFTSLGTLDVSAGTLTINTDTLAISGAAAFTGVLHVQGPGLPDIAIFTFDDLTISSGVTLTLQGSRPIAILSKSDAMIDAAINVRGSFGSQGGTSVNNGLGGVGRLGGGNGGGFNGPATGPGAGGAFGDGGSGGGGGGFGGIGGVGGFAPTNPISPGGVAYGDLSLALQGGSGGGSNLGGGGRLNGGGGAGGGVIEIGAVGAVTLGQGADARGGIGAVNSNTGSKSGGGGSGGGILVHGSSVTTGAALDVQGGSGGGSSSGGTFNSAGGGGGGGGRIFVAQDTYTLGAAVSFSVNSAGGSGGRSLVIDGGPGNSGVVQLAPALTVIPSGQSPLIFDGGVATLANGWKLLPRDLAVQTGGMVVVTSPFSTGNDLGISGGIVFAGLGWTMTGGAQISGFGQLSGAVTGGATNHVSASGGALTLGDANSSAGFNFAGAIDIASGATLNLLDANVAELGAVTTLVGGGRLNSLNGIQLGAGEIVTASASATIAGKFTNQGTVNGPTAGGQFLTFTDDVDGAGSYTGSVVFSDGFSPGASAAMVSLENFTFDSTTTLSIEIGGVNAGSEFDQLNFTGTGTLDGSLNVTLINGFNPQPGNTFTFIQGGSLAGAFDAMSLPPLDPNFTWSYSQSGNAAVLAVLPEPTITSSLAIGAFALSVVRRPRRS